jgi:hypothetical protein
MLLGALAALAGYLLPWFETSRGGYSGWDCTHINSGWPRFTIACLLLTIGGSLRAGRSQRSAVITVIAGVEGMFFALSVVAASFGSGPSFEMPLGVGLPLMAGGFGLLLVGALRSRRLAPQRRS